MKLTLEDNHNFSKISGDYNPVHLDIEYCRRSPFGTLVVHGIHAVLLGIAYYQVELKAILNDNKRIKLKANFLNPIIIDQEFIFEFSRNGPSAEIFCKDPSTSVVFSKINFNSLSGKVPIDNYKGLGFEVIEEEVNHIDSDIINDQKWANARIILGYEGVNLLTNITRLIGMKYPGNDSIFRDFEIDIDIENKYLSLPIERTFFEPRFRFQKYTLINLGEFQSYNRPKSIDYEDISIKCNIANRIKEAKRIVIFGVSSGLGFGLALSALRQGIEVIGISRSNKSKGIQKLLKDNRFHHIEYDVENLSKVSSSFGIRNTPVFYFCTPSFRFGKKSIFNESLMELYMKYYISLPQIIVNQGCPSLFVQPSSIAIIQKPQDMKEYTEAKIKQEEWMINYTGNTKMICTRLPAVHTDQNNVTGIIKKISITEALNMIMSEL